MVTSLRLAFLSVLLICSLNGTAQSPENLCISKDEEIYTPDKDNVKPPQLQKDKKRTPPVEIKENTQLELLVNAEGRICNVRVAEASDPLLANQLSQYVAEHWRFKSATRQDKPVAVKLTVNFSRNR
jgi:hypothetical protein